MKLFFSLMIAALCPFVKCTPSCVCPAAEEILLKDINFFRFRDPWPFLTSPERLYLKYAPLKLLENIKCVISELIKNDPSSGYLERNVSWTNIGEQPTRESINVELEGTKKSKSEVTAITKKYGSQDFNTVYSDPRCLILRISQSENVLGRSCLLWVKEMYLENPLRHCRFLYDVFCNWKRDDLKPTKDCDKGIKKKDKRPPRADIQNSGATRPPR
uniref:Putative salivary lipocalin n=1 Tax=Ixodes ricinus TaxID=34613 RepID=A0A0K8R337_IXORI